MKLTSVTIGRCASVVLAGLTVVSTAVAQNQAAVGRGDAPADVARATDVVDADVAPFRRELLRLAFGAASKFPSKPHHKNRGRAQELVVVACFELDLPKLALAFAPDVEGWRRGVAYADYAYWAARHGASPAHVEQHLKLAEKVVAEQEGDPHAQEWRADKIKLKMARALHALGRQDAVDALVGSIGAISGGAVDTDWARTMSSRTVSLSRVEAKAELARLVDGFDALALGGQYTSLLTVSAMHGEFFEDLELRRELELLLIERFVKMPPNLRLDALAPLVEHYVSHRNLDGGREVLRRMTEIVEAARWRVEDLMPQLGRIAELRIRIGDRDRARAELDQAVADYFDGRDGIVDIYRCETLRALALAYHALGDIERADGLLQTALEEALENPNSRPRCFDLVETCVALATRGIEPSDTLGSRLQEVSEGLGQPW